MMKFFNTKTGRLRLLGLMEGLSLLLLVGVAVPVKYIYGDPYLVKSIDLFTGTCFLLFVFNALSVGVEQQWKFRDTTWKVLLACMIPFGTFYIDRKILSKIETPL